MTDAASFADDATTLAAGPAPPAPPAGRAPTVAILGYDGVQALDVAGPFEVFARVGELFPELPGYRLRLLSPAGGPFTAFTGLTLGESRPYAEVDPATLDTLIVAGGHGHAGRLGDAALMAWLRAAAPRVRRLASVCSGALLLAEAGLLDGRRATTHWDDCPRLAARYPRVAVAPDAIHVRDGHIYSSAGVTAGMDLSLALVEADYGRRVALAVARRLVLYLKRPGGQSQFSAELLAQEAAGDRFESLVAWIFANLDRRLGVEVLADRAGMSVRSFQRRFTEALGAPPARFVERARVDAARRDLEDGALGVTEIAGRRGFGDAERMRRAFLRAIGVPPADYRARFRGTGTAVPATDHPEPGDPA